MTIKQILVHLVLAIQFGHVMNHNLKTGLSYKELPDKY
jgi:hypothetical protein